MNTNPKLKKLIQKKDQIDARIKLIEAREKSKAKKEDTRRKILIGAMITEQMEKSEDSRKKIIARLDGFLTRPIDRMLFGFDASQSSHKREPEKKQPQTQPQIRPQGEKADDAAKKNRQKSIAG